jgi:competence protein ComEC
VWGYLYGLRSRLIQKFRDGGLEGEELAVASALVLGHRADLDRELMSAYAGAGATHVLAVSGLHVGIVYVILNMLLKFLDKKRYGKIVKTVLLVVALFGYAGLTGLSASVFRAATMFAFVAVGKAIDRNTNIFNTLAASAFVLIAFDPMIIMQVGFQLSYLAVIGIVVIHPILFNLVTVNNRIGDWAWSITCVSIAAQVATFPLGLLYFHQFPNLFLLSNLLVIPAATGILYLGFLLFTFSFWNPTLLFFGKLLNWLISSLNTVVVYIEEIPYSVLTGIDISTIETLIIYAAIVSWLMFLLHRIRPAFYVALGLSVIFMVLQCFEVHRQKTQHFLTVYNVKGHTAISVVEGTKVLFLSDEELYTNEQSMLFHIRHHWWRLGIEEEEFVPISTDISNRELSIGTRNLVLLDLTNPPDGLKIRASQKDDLVCVLHSIKWNSIDNLKQLASSRIVIPDRFGPKVLERIKTMNESGNLSMLSDQGAFKLCED